MSVAFGAGAILIVWSLTALVSRLRRQNQIATVLLLNPELDAVETLDEAATRILQQVATWVQGRAYHAYWLNADGTSLQLRASLTQHSHPAVAPDYSGLVLESVTAVALAKQPDPTLEGPRVRGARDERWLDLPFGPHLLISIFIGPLGEVSAPFMAELAVACQVYAPFTLAVHQWFSAREEAERNRHLMDSTRIALDVTLHSERALELLLNVGSQAVEADAQVAIVEGTGDQPLTIANTPEGRRLGELILRGGEPALTMLPLQPDVVPGSQLATLGSAYNGCIRIPIVLNGNDSVGCFFYFTKQAPAVSTYQKAVLRTLGERAVQILANQRQMQGAAAEYLDTLRVLTTAMDGLSPNSQGHSDRLAFLARLIAAEMRMPEPEVEAVAMAAYFHDVGMVAVDPRVVLKPQQLTADEYAQVKRHAELGGQLVASLPAAIPLAPIVAGHHERWDGHGYPRGLKGEEIPLGARILAAADLFEAKTTGRAYRAAVPYLKALEEIRTAAGNHLDPRVVKALMAAFERLQQPAAPNLPLSPCWLLKQMPEHVCAGCPNRKPQPVRCWENMGNLCTRHGDRCEECLVYTEAMSRKIRTPVR
jgi:HD-GYP domain-containing protein (c-di-GMP phosphodiesterase class II)